jgi:hypothetical protein
LADDRHRVQQHLLVVRRKVDEAADDGAARGADMADHIVLQGVNRRVRLHLHAREEPLSALAVRHAVVEDQRDHDIEHVAEQADESPA